MSDQGHMGGGDDALWEHVKELAREAATDPGRAARELAALKSLYAAAMEKIEGAAKLAREQAHIASKARMQAQRAMKASAVAANTGLYLVPHGPREEMQTKMVEAAAALLEIDRLLREGRCGCEHGCDFSAEQKPLRRMGLAVKPTRALSLVQAGEQKP